MPEAADAGVGAWRRRFAFLCAAQVVIWTTLPLVFYPNVSLDVAEIVAWGHQWQFGYYKHPPLVAWLCEGARQVEFLFGGGKPWAIYLLGQLAVVLTFWAVWRFARRLMPAPQAFLAVLGLAGSYVCTVKSLEFNHNILLLPFFALTGWIAFEALRQPPASATRAAWGWWLALGTAIGLGMLVKYEMLFLAVCVAGFILVDPRSRRWLTKPQPYAGLALSLLIFSPNLKWLVDNHFVSLTYAQSRLDGESGLVSHLTSPILFLRDQAIFVAAIYLVIAVWMRLPRLQWGGTEEEKWSRRFVMMLALGPIGMFLLMALATGNSLRGDWGIPLICFVPLLLMVLFSPRAGRGAGATRLAMAAGVVVIGIEMGADDCADGLWQQAHPAAVSRPCACGRSRAAVGGGMSRQTSGGGGGRAVACRHRGVLCRGSAFGALRPGKHSRPGES